MGQRTPLYDVHRALGARMVDFGGWDMPLAYGSQIEEHHAVRRACGMFDVSHMRLIDIGGADALAFLRVLLCADAGRAGPGRAIYSCMLRDDGGVLDDLIAYRLEATEAPWRLAVNAATALRDRAWMEVVAQARGFDVRVRVRDDLALIAVQGPTARARLAEALPELAGLVEPLRVYSAATQGEYFVARTGYTGEDGCEVALPAAQAVAAWERLAAVGVPPCGLGARDTLRLEAGMNLYGADMDESVTPFESGLGWTVDLGAARDFIGRRALMPVAGAHGLRQLLGLRLEGPGVLRAHQVVRTPGGAGLITSGGFAPTMACSIALARLPAGVAVDERVEVELRGGLQPARVCRPPFVRNGRVLVS